MGRKISIFVVFMVVAVIVAAFTVAMWRGQPTSSLSTEQVEAYNAHEQRLEKEISDLKYQVKCYAATVKVLQYQCDDWKKQNMMHLERDSLKRLK